MNARNTVRVPPITRYVVEGALGFPIDMLRYDAAWPASEFDSNKITRSVQYAGAADGVIQVEVYARGELTLGRWQSFGWRVIRAEAVVNL